MEITYQNEWEHTDIHVDFEFPYEEDYQMKMLDNNDVQLFLPVCGRGRNGESRYTFRLENGISMENIYSEQEITGKEIESFMEQLSDAIEKIHMYLLDHDHIILDPKLIFIKEGKYKFCYLPVKKRYFHDTLCKSFHQLTEYFVKKLDYKDTRGVLLVSKLHRETMKEGCELKQIMEECKKDLEEYKINVNYETATLETNRDQGALSENVIFSLDNGGGNQVSYVKEEEEYMKSSKNPFEKVFHKIKGKRWGQWDDLITEIEHPVK